MSTSSPRTRSRSLARGAAASLIAQMTSLLATILVGVVISRAFGPVGKGELALMQQVSWLTATVLGLGLTAAHSYFVGTGQRTGTQAFSDSLAFATTVSVPGCVVAFVIMRSVMPSLDSVSDPTLALATLLIPLTILSSHATAIEVGHGRIRRVAVAQITSAVLTVATAAALAFTGNATVTAMLALQCVALLASTTIVAADIRGWAGRLLCRPSPSRLRRQAAYASRSYAADMANLLSLRQDVVLLGILSTAANVGLYSVGVSFTELLWQLPNALLPALFARSVKADETEGHRTAALALRVSLIMMAVATIVLSIIVGPLIVALFGPQFAASSAVFYILIPGMLLMGLGRISFHHLAARGKPLTRPALLSAALNLAGNIVVIPVFGYLGAATVSSVSYSLYGILMLAAFSRQAGLGAAEMLIPRRSDFKIVVRGVLSIVRPARPEA